LWLGIDCGWVKTTSVNYEGPLVVATEQYSQESTLNGRMNLFIKEIGPNLTQVKVRARYIFNVVDTPTSRQTWVFDTGGSDSKRIGSIKGNVTCQPTHKAESEIIKGIEKISKGVPFD